MVFVEVSLSNSLRFRGQERERVTETSRFEREREREVNSFFLHSVSVEIWRGEERDCVGWGYLRGKREGER